MSGGPWIVIETTSRLGQVALADVDGKVLRSAEFPQGPRHPPGLAVEAKRVCDAAGFSPRELAGVAVSIGPGGFTGTRVGVTFAKTLAYAAGLQCVAVPTAAVVARNAPAEATVAAAVVDARRGSIWSQIFRRDGDGWAAEGEGVLSTPAKLLARLPRPAWVVGEGVDYHADSLAADGVTRLGGEPSWPRVGAVAGLAMDAVRRGEVTTAAAMSVLYVRRPEAEEKRLAAGTDGR